MTLTQGTGFLVGPDLVPLRYRDTNFVNALQWTIGLELFLLSADPWRVVLSTNRSESPNLTYVPPTGFEPVIFRMRGGRPGPLDDGSATFFAHDRASEK